MIDDHSGDELHDVPGASEPDASPVRDHAGPSNDLDRYELLGRVEGHADAWNVLDHCADVHEALFTLVALRPAAAPVPGPAASADGEEEPRPEDDDGAPVDPALAWRERADALTRVRHPRLAPVVRTFDGPPPHAPGAADQTVPAWQYAVVQQTAGRSVVDWLDADGGAAVEDRFAVLATTAYVLQELHRGSEGSGPLAHGDITPRTVRLAASDAAQGVRLAAAAVDAARAGRATGAYTAPEVRAGAEPSVASDVFAFAATAVHVLTGQVPATDADGVLHAGLVRKQFALAPLTAAYPALADLLLRGLSDDPAERPDRLPAWVDAMRAVTVQGSAPSRGAVSNVLSGLGTSGQSTRTASPRVLRHRPIAVVVGALVLASAGTATAVSAVQRGHLEQVPNPVAIVQPGSDRPATPSPTLTPVSEPTAPRQWAPVRSSQPAASRVMAPVATTLSPEATPGTLAAVVLASSPAAPAPASPAATVPASRPTTTTTTRPSTPEPTRPTAAPTTSAPTGAPTVGPGPRPTSEPTREPTQEPTEEPSEEPTREPTEEPTTPTAEPTTAEPTEGPTTPTERPTRPRPTRPTTEPTDDEDTAPGAATRATEDSVGLVPFLEGLLP